MAVGAVVALLIAVAYEDFVEYRRDPFISGSLAAGFSTSDDFTAAAGAARQVAGDRQGGFAIPADGPEFQQFPEDFAWGAATAAHQIEGAAAEGGRAPSVWDDLTHANISQKWFSMHTADVACDHYHRFRDDVRIMAKLGLKAYRFSISWSRLIPDGDGAINEEGARFYSDLINELLANGIEPWVTLFHWDLPSALNNGFGGFLGPKDRMVNAFGHYSRVCFQRFGDRVKRWMTLNEPYVFALSYMVGFGWPSKKDGGGVDPYTVAHALLLSHAEAVRVYRDEFKATQGGLIGIVINTDWVHAYNASSVAEVAAAQRANDFQLGWFADPVFFGDYPRAMREALGDRLPEFTAREKDLLRGSSDFFGVNNYFSAYAFPPPASAVGNLLFRHLSRWLTFEGAYYADRGVRIREDPAWERVRTGSGWPIVPWGFRDLLVYIQERYNPPEGIVVTENGCSFETDESKALDQEPGAMAPQPYNAAAPPAEDWDRETFPDPDRVRYLKAHLSAVHAARARGAKIKGYFLWSLLDNFEWIAGFRIRFGIVRVDYRTQKRTLKESARFYAEVIRRGGLDPPPKAEEYAGAPPPNIAVH